MAALADITVGSQECAQLLNYWAPEGCNTISKNHFFKPPLRCFWSSSSALFFHFRWSLLFFFETSMACICFSSPLPLPVHLQSWPKISIFHDCVLLKSLSGLKTSLKPLSPLTEQVRHPKYLGALGFCSVFVFATEMNLCNYPLNSNQARVQSSQTCFVQSAWFGSSSHHWNFALG